LFASLAKAISGRAEIVEWKLDTDMMMCKKSSDAHLFSHDIIDFRGKQCILFSPICTTLFGNYVIVSPILSSSNCQFYRRWTSWKCLTRLVNFLAGMAGQFKRNESRGVFYQLLKIMRLRYTYLFVSLAYTFKRHGYSSGECMLWTKRAIVGASDAMESIYATFG